MQFLNGFKTVLGLSAVLVSTIFHKDIAAVSQVGDAVFGIVSQALLTVGLIHKAIKSTPPVT